MLPPDYFTNKEDRLLELYRQLEDFILKDITRRLLSAGEMTATADRLIWKLKQMGESQAAIEQKLRKLTGLTQKELRALLQDVVLTSWEDDTTTLKQLGIELSNPLENAAVIRVMDAEYKKSLGELKNLTRTTMKQAGNDFINMLDEADLRVTAGVQSYSAAVCDILDRYAGQGIYVDYPSRTRRTLEAAVRCCVVTSMNQTAAQVTNQYIVEGGIEYVLVSAHLGARVQGKGQPELAGHDNWQGRVYKIRGSSKGYPNLLESTGYDVDPETGQGTVVNPLGLHGYNCRHSHKPWDLRLRNPYMDENGNMKIDTEENRKRYELQQKQRYMERSIRATKRKLIEKQEQLNMIAETDVRDILQSDYDKLAYKMTQQNKAYNDFCKDNDLQPQYDRIKVADFGREQTKLSNAGARRHKNSVSNTVEKLSDPGTIKLSDNEKRAMNRYISSDSYHINDKLRRGEKLSEGDKAFIKDLDSALDKIPEYKGTVYRSVSDFGIEDVDTFIKSHIPGRPVIFPSYISASESIYDKSFPIQYVIQSKHGKDIRVQNMNEKEILFKRDTGFWILKVEGNTIYLEEK